MNLLLYGYDINIKFYKNLPSHMREGRLKLLVVKLLT
jgi:hypothetical protein